MSKALIIHKEGESKNPRDTLVLMKVKLTIVYDNRKFPFLLSVILHMDHHVNHAGTQKVQKLVIDVVKTLRWEFPVGGCPGMDATPLVDCQGPRTHV